MKKLVSFSITLAAIFLLACQPQVLFDKPQPADLPALENFPKRLQGKYLSLNDSTILAVTDNALIRIYDFDMEVHISQIDSNFQLVGDSIVDLRTNEKTLAIISGDSILQHFHDSDTLFAINELNVLKKFKGYYFVNIQDSPAAWQVKKLEFRKGALTIGDINLKEDIDQLKAITETAQDPVPYKFSPTKKQFKTFVHEEGFRNTEKFLKIKE